MKRRCYLHPIIWGRRDRDVLPFIIFINFLLKLKDWVSEDATAFSTYRLFFTMCCLSSDTGISPHSLNSSRASHGACSPSCSFNNPLLKFNPLDLHFVYFRSETRHPVFVNCLCLHTTRSKSLGMSETSLPLGPVTTGPAAWGLLGRDNAGPTHANTGQLDLQMPFYPPKKTLSEGRERRDGKQPGGCIIPKKAALRDGWEQNLISSLCCLQSRLLLPPSWVSEPSLFSWSQNRSITSLPLHFSICKLGLMCVKLPEILCREVPQKWKVLAISILVNILLDWEWSHIILCLGHHCLLLWKCVLSDITNSVSEDIWGGGKSFVWRDTCASSRKLHQKEENSPICFPLSEICRNESIRARRTHPPRASISYSMHRSRMTAHAGWFPAVICECIW